MAANAEQIDESLKRQALAEEEAAMNQYKKSTNPFLSSPTSSAPPSTATTTATSQQQPILDLFGGEVDGQQQSSHAAAVGSQKASDDLLQLAANPFASPVGAAPVIPPLPSSGWAAAPSHNGFGMAQQSQQFASDNNFAAAFGAPANGSTNGKSRCPSLPPCLNFRVRLD